MSFRTMQSYRNPLFPPHIHLTSPSPAADYNAAQAVDADSAHPEALQETLLAAQNSAAYPAARRQACWVDLASQLGLEGSPAAFLAVGSQAVESREERRCRLVGVGSLLAWVAFLYISIISAVLKM